MITIKYIPNILNNEGRKKVSFLFNRDLSVKEYLKMADIDSSNSKVILCGKKIEDLNRPLDRGDELIVTPDVEFAAIATWWAAAIFWQGVVLVAGIITTVASVAMAIFGATRKIKTPNYGTNDNASPTYGWDGIQTTQDVGLPVPIVYGTHRVGGNIINAYIRTDGDKNYLNVLLGLCEGEVEDIADIKVNKQPVANYDGITSTIRKGTNSQAIIPNFQDLHNLYAQTQVLTKNNPWVYTTIATDASAFEIQLIFPYGIYNIGNDGAINTWAVIYTVEYKLHGDPSYTSLGSFTISERSRTAVRRTFRHSGLTPGQYDIRITKTSDDSSTYYVGDVQVNNMDEILTGDLAYPNTALLGIEALATDQLSGTSPQFTVLIKGKKVLVPQVMYSGSEVVWDDYYWDPATSQYKRFSDDAICTWDGSTYVERYSANPIWCLRDLLTNTRYGLGDYVDSTMLDATLLLQKSRYCEEKVPDGSGGYEKRFRVDMVLDQSMAVPDVLLQFAGTFRGLIFFSEGAIKITIDAPGDSVQLFGMGNIVEGSFTQAWKSVKEMFNVAKVRFNDKDKDYEQNDIGYEYPTSLTTDPMRPTDLQLYFSKISYVVREARYRVNVYQKINKTINFRVGIDAIACQAGDLIDFSHDVPQWGFSGNVISGTSNSVTLDKEVTLETAKTYKIRIRHADYSIEEKTVTNAAGTYSVLTISGTFATTPAAYEVYAFGESGKVVKQFRIVNMRINNSNECEVSAVEVDNTVYDDSAVVVPDSYYSSLGFSTNVPNVTDLLLTEGTSLLPDGTVKSTIDVWFNKPSNDGYLNKYLSARIYLSDDGGASYKFIDSALGIHYEIRTDFEKKAYMVKVVTVCSNGYQGNFDGSPSGSITIVGRTTAPAQVQDFSYSWGDVLLLAWGNNTELDVAGYEIRDQNSNWGADDIHQIYKGSANRKTLVPATRSPGTFYIKAFNSSGVYSVTATSLTPQNQAPTVPTGLAADVMFNVARAYWIDTADADLLYYEIYKSETGSWAGEESLVGKVSGKSIELSSKAPRGGTAQSGGASTITDSNLSGLGNDYFNGDTITITKGTGVGQTRTISDFVDATGEIAVDSAWNTQPDATSVYMITDSVYVKVRAVDRYGPGSFTSALKVEFANITESMLGDNIITARKIYVACLSALSANMGTITAGIIQGGTIQTGSGGARTVFDSTGIYSYNANCVKLFEVKEGNICAGSLCLFDPSNACNYSYLYSGALKFHDVLGDVPYVKRICSGVACTGDTVILLGWCDAPKIVVSPNSLMSYNSASSGSCQSWKVYADSPTWFCTSATCYGYCFSVHACLTTTGSVGSETVKDVGFGTSVYTATGVCGTNVRLRFQIWCNNAAPSNYYYGSLSYVICYRVVGAGSYCSCSYTYAQPHANVTELKTTQSVCKCLTFPCNAQWEIVAAQSSLAYVDAGICATSQQNLVCTVYGTNCSPLHVCPYNGNGTYATCYYSDAVSFSGLPSNIYCSILYWCLGGCIGQWKNSACTSWGQCTWFSDCAGTLSVTTLYQGNVTVNCMMPAGQRSHAAASGRASMTFCSCIQTLCQSGISPYRCETGWTCVSVTAICQVLCYTVYTGGAASCCYTNLYTIQDTYGTSCVLDPAGCINWMAIAYS
ncbi:MAG: hypothetical protein HZB36_02510 [Candidatus Omnitrophica bacterium]|nr:hypothetical protein [Candidatus Omnitrophota bacterium]